MKKLLFVFCIAALMAGCGGGEEQVEAPAYEEPTGVAERLAKYTTVRLTTDMAALSDNERKMIPLLIDAAGEMDALFWEQAYGDKDALLSSADSEDMRRYLEINYGPWDRLADNEPFMDGVGSKPKGANFYPTDMTTEEFENGGKSLRSLYTMVRRNDTGGLEAVPYSTAFAEGLQRASQKLQEASKLADDPGLKRYLELRAEALTTDDYQPSDLAWMDMKNNGIDVVIGPIETYEDQLFGFKSAFEAYVLIKDKEWSERLARYATLLPMLQEGLPVPAKYKKETPGSDSDLNAYDVIYYAGDCNSGSKTIAINLPNDEEVQLKKGTRRLQLKNTIRAKFDRILRPISVILVAEDQRHHVTFDAFFGNTMFHEVAHGLGIKNTINGKGTVREALKDQASAVEEGKADVLGLYMVTRLHEDTDMRDEDLKDNYVTFMASIFRSIRFGSASAHGRANLARFNFFLQEGAFAMDQDTGAFSVDFERMRAATNALAEKLLRFQGDGDHDGVKEFMEEMAVEGEELQDALDNVAAARIPVDVIFEQGMSVLEPAVAGK